ncbi:MAG: hypothetical protein JNN20_06040 [Betaproteobacteria bacterium]|nr:hypothetical protein [Betaproteobacteria bacterium]
MRVFSRLVTMTFMALFAVVNAPAIAETMTKGGIEPARDLQKDARQAAINGVPLVVMISLVGCPHCEVVRRSHLLPLLKQSPSALPPLLRQVELKSSQSLIDFNGVRITHADFAKRSKATIAPVVLFFGANGEQIANPLVGSMIPDFYGSYFDAALMEARSNAAKLKARTNP